MTTTKIVVNGMTCNGCVNSVANALARVAGVSKTDVSLAGRSATVEFDPAATTPGEIVAAIEGAGFEAREA
jgi:copper chaperone